MIFAVKLVLKLDILLFSFILISIFSSDNLLPNSLLVIFKINIVEVRLTDVLFCKNLSEAFLSDEGVFFYIIIQIQKFKIYIYVMSI